MMRLCWGKASFDVDADAEDAALKKVDDDADDDVPFRRRRRKRGARDEMRDMMMMMMMIRRDMMMNFCGGKILNCFYENHHRHKKYTRIGGKLALVENGQQVHAARPHRRRAGRRGRRRRGRVLWDVRGVRV